MIVRRNVQRAVLGVVAAGLTVGIVAVPSAAADPDPCSAANLAETISSLNHNLSQYLAAHPDTNQALSDMTKQSPYAALGVFSSYFDAHPQAAQDVRALQQPLKDLANQCGYQVTPGQIQGALWDL